MLGKLDWKGSGLHPNELVPPSFYTLRLTKEGDTEMTDESIVTHTHTTLHREAKIPGEGAGHLVATGRGANTRSRGAHGGIQSPRRPEAHLVLLPSARALSGTLTLRNDALIANHRTSTIPRVKWVPVSFSHRSAGHTSHVPLRWRLPEL